MHAPKQGQKDLIKQLFKNGTHFVGHLCYLLIWVRSKYRKTGIVLKIFFKWQLYLNPWKTGKDHHRQSHRKSWNLKSSKKYEPWLWLNFNRCCNATTISYDLMNSWNYFYIDKCSFTSVLKWFKQVGEKVAAWWSSLLKIVLAVVIELLVGSIFILITSTLKSLAIRAIWLALRGVIYS